MNGNYGMMSFFFFPATQRQQSIRHGMPIFMSFINVVVALACAALAHGASLPAPRSDFFFSTNLTYHNVGTLGPASKFVVAAAHDTNVWLEVRSNRRDTHQTVRARLNQLRIPYLHPSVQPRRHVL